MVRPDHDWLLDEVADAANGWAVGTFGAIAEFTREPGEVAILDRAPDRAEVTTTKGALRLIPSEHLWPVAYETPNRDGETWTQAVALCLPAEKADASRRDTLTELGCDLDAIRSEDRDAILFDMGLGTRQVDVCIRSRDPDLVASLRSIEGRSLFEVGNRAMATIVAAGPHRVFIGHLGRCEVYQPIPPPDGRSPDGPHTHVLPRLLKTGRTHAATTPIPEGLVPLAHLFPPNPVVDRMGRRKPFDQAAHRRFSALLEQFGDATSGDIRRTVKAAIASNRGPEGFPAPIDRYGRATIRVTLRQLEAGGDRSQVLQSWRELFDRTDMRSHPDEDEQPSHALIPDHRE